MRSVIRASKMDHTIKTCKGGTAALAMMLVEFLLGQDVSTILSRSRSVAVGFAERAPIRKRVTSQEKDTIWDEANAGVRRPTWKGWKEWTEAWKSPWSMAKWMELLRWVE